LVLPKPTSPAAKTSKPAGKGAAKPATGKGSAPAKKTASKPKKPEARKPEPKKAEPKKADARKPEVKKPELKKPELKKPDARKPEAKGAKPAPKAATPAKPGSPAKPAAKPTTEPKGPDGKPVRKGITIVSNKPQKKASAKAALIKMPEMGPSLGDKYRKPLISSGPNAPRPKTLGMADDKPKKSPFNAKELARFRGMLLKKRSELIGDVSTMESEALNSQAGSLSNLPQHMAEQGSDAYGQSLSLDLAAADRRLIKEIDDALKRIADGTYGICELTGKPIRAERLEELPWARYSIEAARELERRSTATLCSPPIPHRGPRGARGPGP
jgi:RNA polymerase-binding transcription factor DksA